MNYRLLLAAALGHFVVDVHQGALPVLLPVLRERYDLSYSLVASLVLVLQIASALLQPTVGLLSDRFSFRWIVPVSCALAGIGFSIVLAGGYALVALGIFICGVGVAAFHPEGSKLAFHASDGRKGLTLSVFSMGGNAGTAVGPLLMSYLLLGWGLRGVLGLLFLSIPAAIVFARLVPHLYRTVPATSRKVERGEGPLRESGVLVPFVLLIALVILRSWAHTSTITFMPLYFVSHLGLSTQFSGAMLTLYLTCGTIATAFMGLVADRWGVRATMVVTMAAATALLMGFPHATGWWRFVVVALAGVSMMSTYGITTALGQQMLPRQVGLASGLVLGATVGTGGFGAVLMGHVADRWGIETALAGIPVFALLGTAVAVALVVLHRRTTLGRPELKGTATV